MGWLGDIGKSAFGGVLGGVTDFVSGLFGGDSGKKDRKFNSAQAALQRDWSAKEAQTARDFEERMSNTSIQRRVSDLEAAGLNPMLAYSDAASSPNASAPSGAAAHSNDTGSAKSMARVAAVNSAAGLRRNEAEIEQIRAGTAKTMADTSLTEDIRRKMVAETVSSTTSAGNMLVDRDRIRQETKRLLQETDKLFYQVGEVNVDVESKNLDMDQRRQMMPLIKRMAELDVQAESLGINLKENMSEAQKSWWMRNVAPYIPDILKSTGAAQSAGSAARSFKAIGPR